MRSRPQAPVLCVVLNFYNDNDAKVCAWSQGLIDAGLIPSGDVRCASVADLDPHEFSRYTQCHFFNGVSGWSLALRLAGWPEHRRVWTASLPCQPFSGLGLGLGVSDRRHMWPIFFQHVVVGQPPVIFGEQVASKAGQAWLARVRADLEGAGYAVGAASLCAAGIKAPQIRKRLYWVAYATGKQTESADQKRLYAEPDWDRDEGHWDRCEDVFFPEGKRRIEPGTEPVVARFPSSVVQCRGYGNSIVPPLAARFIRSVSDVIDQTA